MGLFSKGVKGSVIVIFLAIFSHASYIFAQSCNACDTAPEGVQTYTEMVDTLLALFPTQDAGQGGTGSVNFAGKIAQGATLQEAVLQTILAPHTTYDMYAAINMTYKDESLQRDRKELMNTQIKIINRTLQLVNSGNHLEKIPRDVIQTIDTELKKLGYVQLSKNGSSYELEVDGATYEILARLLWQFQMLYEELHTNERYHQELYAVGEGQDKSDEADVEKAIQEKENERLLRASMRIWESVNSVFTTQATANQANNVELMQYLEFPLYATPLVAYVWQVQEDYACSVGLARNVCNEDWQEARKDSAFTFKERIAKDASHAKNTFLSAWTRLKGVFKKGSTDDGAARQQREEALLNSYRGSEVPSKSARRDVANVESQIDPVPTWPGTLWKNVSRSWKSMSNTFADTGRAWKRLGNRVVGALNPSVATDPTPIAPTAQDANKYPDKTAKQQVLIDEKIGEDVMAYEQEAERFFGGIQKDGGTDLKEASLQDTFYSVLDMQEKMQAASVFNEVNRTTKKFPVLSAAVYNNIALLGKKNPVNTSEGGLYYAMSKVCDLQCANLEGKICQHIGD